MSNLKTCPHCKGVYMSGLGHTCFMAPLAARIRRPNLDIFITVQYSCDSCGIEDIPVQVKARGDEDLEVWMNEMVLALGMDHQQRSPHCRSKKMDEVKIPMGATVKIGGPAVQ